MWRVYYADGSTFSHKDGTPEEAPGWGVVCVVQPDAKVGRNILERWDFYYFHEDGRWWGCDQWGLIDRLAHRLPMRAVSVGRTIAETEYEKILEAARNDPEFPQRCSNRPQFYEKPQALK